MGLLGGAGGCNGWVRRNVNGEYSFRDGKAGDQGA